MSQSCMWSMSKSVLKTQLDRKHMPYAEMATYRAAVMMPWDLNLAGLPSLDASASQVMFHVGAQERQKETRCGDALGPVRHGSPALPARPCRPTPGGSHLLRPLSEELKARGPALRGAHAGRDVAPPALTL